MDKNADYTILNTTIDDLPMVNYLFDRAIELQGKNGYRVWEEIDQPALILDIQNGMQYKVVSGADILCIFSVQRNDLIIWRHHDQNDGIYLHRIAVNPDYKGQKQFEKILNWARDFVINHDLKYIRIDTWADNKRLIDYYLSYGFEFLENFRTPDLPELPSQDRNINLALMQMVVEGG